MRRVQRTAIELFEARSFNDVSIVDIAEAADVAQRSVYRYFGTKEGIVTWNAFDDEMIDQLIARLDGMSLRDALRTQLATIDVNYTDEEQSWAARQVTLIDSTPQLRAHMAGAIEEMGRRLGSVVAVSRGRDPDDQQSRLDAIVAATAIFAAAFDWIRSGASEPPSVALLRALDSIETWATR